ncbi:hypothetical protein B0H10DRAFT_2231471 [Mycena sp. CBHHK59/15]|nr:hypothetical protein B0H10DRAFT_2231471 [Mycena sp. CBHHK59/15]
MSVNMANRAISAPSPPLLPPSPPSPPPSPPWEPAKCAGQRLDDACKSDIKNKRLLPELIDTGSAPLRATPPMPVMPTDEPTSAPSPICHTVSLWQHPP